MLTVPFWQAAALTNGTHFILFGITAIWAAAAREVDCGAIADGAIVSAEVNTEAIARAMAELRRSTSLER